MSDLSELVIPLNVWRSSGVKLLPQLDKLRLQALKVGNARSMEQAQAFGMAYDILTALIKATDDDA